MGKLTEEVFNESCCDGGEGCANDLSAQPCGCDEGAGWICSVHQELAAKQAQSLTSLAASAKTASFAVKDSGKRMEFSSGMVRDLSDDKTDYSLVYDGPMHQRWAEHLTKGAQKYNPRNWMLAAGQAELDRFKASAARHFAQWMRGDLDEDHAAAVIFNLNGAEYVKGKL